MTGILGTPLAVARHRSLSHAMISVAGAVLLYSFVVPSIRSASAVTTRAVVPSSVDRQAPRFLHEPTVRSPCPSAPFGRRSCPQVGTLAVGARHCESVTCTASVGLAVFATAVRATSTLYVPGSSPTPEITETSSGTSFSYGEYLKPEKVTPDSPARMSFLVVPSVRVPVPNSFSSIVVALLTVMGCCFPSTASTTTSKVWFWTSNVPNSEFSVFVTDTILREFFGAALAGPEIPATAKTAASSAAINTARERRTGGIMGNAFPWEIFMLRHQSAVQEKFTQMPGEGWSLSHPPTGVPPAPLVSFVDAGQRPSAVA